MDVIYPIAFVIIIVGFFVATILSFFLFDKLVRTEYGSHRSQWIADGMPHGFFWIPPEPVTFGDWLLGGRHALARHRFSRKLLFSTPHWVRSDPHCRKLQNYYRVVTFGPGIAALCFFIAILFS